MKIECKYVRVRNKIFAPKIVQVEDTLAEGTKMLTLSTGRELVKEHPSINQAKAWSRLEQIRNGGLGRGSVRVETK